MIYNKPSLILTKSEEAPSVAGATRRCEATSANSSSRSVRLGQRLAVASGNVGELQFASEETSERAVRFLMPGLSDSVFWVPPWFIKKNILTNDLRLLY